MSFITYNYYFSLKNTKICLKEIIYRNSTKIEDNTLIDIVLIIEYSNQNRKGKSIICNEKSPPYILYKNKKIKIIGEDTPLEISNQEQTSNKLSKYSYAFYLPFSFNNIKEMKEFKNNFLKEGILVFENCKVNVRIPLKNAKEIIDEMR